MRQGTNTDELGSDYQNRIMCVVEVVRHAALKRLRPGSQASIGHQKADRRAVRDRATLLLTSYYGKMIHIHRA